MKAALASIARITVPASWLTESGGTRHRPAEFKLGLGPCGLTVSSLGFAVHEGCAVIQQHHTDGPSKHFVYPLAQLHGRIEIEEA